MIDDDEDDDSSVVGPAIPEVVDPPGSVPSAAPDVLGSMVPTPTSSVVSAP